jgi:cytochrome c553
MKRALLLVLIAIVTMTVAMAQIPQTTNLTTDILGAHLVYGRGCIACHAPHSGSAGNGVRNGDATNGDTALWGEDLTPLYGKTLTFGNNTAVTLPANGAGIVSASDPTAVILFCLSCHDGNVAKPGMMKGVTVETLPVVGGTAPTFLGNDGTTAGNYSNDHPVGVNAVFGCNPPGGTGYNWDCTISATGKVSMTGTASSVFANTNYGFAVSLPVVNNVPVVTCTSCHNQHSELIYSGKMGGVTGYYQTAFFLRGYYNPTTGGNNAAQFCRQCHGGESNEMAGQLGVPTT